MKNILRIPREDILAYLVLLEESVGFSEMTSSLSREEYHVGVIHIYGCLDRIKNRFLDYFNKVENVKDWDAFEFLKLFKQMKDIEPILFRHWEHRSRDIIWNDTYEERTFFWVYKAFLYLLDESCPTEVFLPSISVSLKEDFLKKFDNSMAPLVNGLKL